MRGIGFVLVGLALAVAAGDWFAVGRENRRAEYVLKPLTLTLLIAAAGFPAARAPGRASAFTIAALVLSLAGDVFLMLPADLFVAGLGAFLLAHVAYVVAFNGSTPPEPVTALAAAGVAAAAIPLFARMRAGMARSGQTEYAIPVAVYVLAIGAMVVSAIATAGRADWSGWRSAAAIAGALLFMASDSLIGWNRFVQEVRGAQVLIMVTYHLGQALLVVGLLG
jgi:uncharacterized membrane protein YhhN